MKEKDLGEIEIAWWERIPVVKLAGYWLVRQKVWNSDLKWWGDREGADYDEVVGLNERLTEVLMGLEEELERLGVVTYVGPSRLEEFEDDPLDQFKLYEGERKKCMVRVAMEDLLRDCVRGEVESENAIVREIAKDEEERQGGPKLWGPWPAFVVSRVVGGWLYGRSFPSAFRVCRDASFCGHYERKIVFWNDFVEVLVRFEEYLKTEEVVGLARRLVEQVLGRNLGSGGLESLEGVVIEEEGLMERVGW